MEELVELGGARELDIFIRELHHVVLLDAHKLVGWLRLELNLKGLVAPQVLEILVIVSLDVVPQHLVHLGVFALSLPHLVVVGIAVLVLVQE